jgi:hypothetical protein
MATFRCAIANQMLATQRDHVERRQDFPFESVDDFVASAVYANTKGISPRRAATNINGIAWSSVCVLIMNSHFGLASNQFSQSRTGQ